MIYELILIFRKYFYACLGGAGVQRSGGHVFWPAGRGSRDLSLQNATVLRRYSPAHQVKKKMKSFIDPKLSL